MNSSAKNPPQRKAAKPLAGMRTEIIHKMKLAKRTIILLIFLVPIYSYSQKDITSLKSSLTTSLSDFENATKTNEGLKHINTFYFKKILSSIDIKSIPVAFQNDTTADLFIHININAVDTSFSYYYMNWGGHSESYYKNCYPKDNRFNYEPNIIQTSSVGNDLISIDTLFNVIITKPTNQKYEVYRSSCPGGASKVIATKYFMQRILGQYQLIIRINNKRTIGYFVAPPKPTDKFRLRHTTGSF